MQTTRKCRNCDGTGKILCLNSGFTADGYRRERCGICAGAGEASDFQPDPGYARFQRNAHANVAAWGALRPQRAAAPR